MTPHEIAYRACIRQLVEKLDRYANRQGKRRMVGKSFREGTKVNPNAGSHYPAVQSAMDSAKNLLSTQ